MNSPGPDRCDGGGSALLAARRYRLAGLFSFAVSASLGLLLSPVLLALLGASGFGAWKTVHKLFDTALASQGGATQAVKWVIARRGPSPYAPAMRRILGAAFAQWLRLLAPFGLLAMALLLALACLDSGAPTHDLVIAGTLLALNGLLTGLLALPAAALIGANRGHLAVLPAAATAVLTNLAMVWAAWSGLGLPGLAASTLLCAVLGAGMVHLVARHALPWWGMAAPTAQDRASLRRLGRWSLLWTYLDRWLLSGDFLLVALLAGASMAARFAFTAYAAQMALALCLLGTSASMPALGQWLAGPARPAALALMRRTREINRVLIATAATGILALNGGFVVLWAGPDMYLGPEINALIVLSMLQVAHIRNEAQILDTIHQLRARAPIALAAALAGAAAAFGAHAMTGSLVWALLAIVVARLPLNLALTRLAWRHGLVHSPSLAPALAIAPLLLAGHAVGTAYRPGSLPEFALAVLAIGLFAGAYSLKTLLPAASRTAMRDIFPLWRAAP